MQKPDRIDFNRLLGFELLTRELSQALDFHDESFGAKLGAKVGGSSEDGPARIGPEPVDQPAKPRR